MDTDVTNRNRVDVIIRDRDVINKLIDVRDKNNLTSWVDVIKFLLDVYYKCSDVTTKTSDVNVKTSNETSNINKETYKVTSSINRDVRVGTSKTSIEVNHIPSNSPTRLTPEDYLDNNDFQEMMDAIKTAINRGERNKISGILRYFLGDKLLTNEQYEKLTRQYEWIREMLIFNGRGYKVQ